MMERRTRSAPGFTLVEVLIALTITTLIGGAVYLAASTAIDASQRTRALQEAGRARRNTQMLLGALLRSARGDQVREERRFRGVDGSAAPSGSDELWFSAALGFPFAGYPEHEPLGVHLWVGEPRAGDAEPGAPAPPSPPRALLLELRPWPPRSQRADTVALLSPIDAATIAYRDPATGAWLNDWDRPGALPAAVAIEFRATPPTPPTPPSPPLPPLVVHIPVGRTQ